MASKENTSNGVEEKKAVKKAAVMEGKKVVEQEHTLTEYGTKKYLICGLEFEVSSEYAVRKAVGQGAYGLVTAARHIESGRTVAIKKIPKAFEDSIDCKRLLREIKILRHFKHDNILGLVDILPPPEGKDSWKDVYIVSELMDTDLHYIIHSKQPLTDEHFKYFLYQILRGVHAMHSSHVLHRDLKPGNLLVNKNCDLKVCDFGLARPVAPGADAKDMGLTEYVVTRWYRAPELLVENEAYSMAIDAWAVGCILAEMLGRKALFQGRDYLHQLRLIIDVIGTPSEEDLKCINNEQAVSFLRSLPEKPRREWSELYPDAAPEALALLDGMLQFNPAKRITMKEAIECEYLAPLHQGRALPDTDDHFSFGFETATASQDELREMIWKEMLSFHPDAEKAK
mmetsp:Transcript_4013/g.8613  ORF Transcript_4013/g.8613 Transcript_4013/m.8613 type:complete len:398 (+) Transcript_4013:156-1349(+)